MTALDADTLRDLRNLLAAATPGEWETACAWDGGVAAWVHEWGHHWRLAPSTYFHETLPTYQANAALIVALVNAAPALLDAAEAVERIRTLADSPIDELGRAGYIRADDLRAALAPPPDRSKP